MKEPLYVRLPIEEAEKLDRAAFEMKTSKQDLVTDMIRRFTVETTDDGMAVGHAAFRPFSPPDVLTVAELASWLQVDEDGGDRAGRAGRPARPQAGRRVALRARSRAGLARA